MKKLGVLAISLVVLLGVGLLLQSAAPQLAAQDDTRDDSVQRSIQVSGTGQVSATPDEAVITIGVETQTEQASAALSQNSQQMQAVIDSLTQAGIAQADIKTQVVQLNPRYGTGPTQTDQSGPPDIVGYTATNLVEVRVTDLENMGKLLDNAAQAGANRISSIQFEISDPSGVVDQAREAAWADALHKADQLTGLAKAELGDVLTIRESSQVPIPIVARGAVTAEAAAVPVQPGVQTVTVNLDVTWLLQ